MGTIHKVKKKVLTFQTGLSEVSLVVRKGKVIEKTILNQGTTIRCNVCDTDKSPPRKATSVFSSVTK